MKMVHLRQIIKDIKITTDYVLSFYSSHLNINESSYYKFIKQKYF